MKVSIFNGSPKKDGDTAAVTSSMIETMKARGADAEEHFLYHMGVRGCLTCGLGSGRDNAVKMINVFLSSDLAVFACPIYMERITDSLNAFIDLLYHICRYDDEVMEKVGGKKVAAVLTSDDGGASSDDASGMLRRLFGLLKMNNVGIFTVPFSGNEAASPSFSEKVSDFAEKIMNG